MKRSETRKRFTEFLQRGISCVLHTLVVLGLSATERPVFSNNLLNTISQEDTGLTRIQDEENVRPLDYEKPVQREMVGGQTHSYVTSLSAGQYVRIVTEQQGIDVVVKLVGPNGKQIVEVDSPNGTTGPESLSLVIEVSGKYILTVRSLEENAPLGRYELKIAEQRQATVQDRERVAAEQVFNEGKALTNEGTHESLVGAIDKYKIALPIWRRLGERRREGDTLDEIGMAYDSVGEKQKALEYLFQSSELWHMLKDPANEAVAIHNIGAIYGDLENYTKALEYYDRALPLRRAAGDVRGQARTLDSIGTVHASVGDLQKARYFLEQALSLRREAKDRVGEAYTLNNLGFVYSNLGEKQKAIDHFEKSIPIWRETNDLRSEAVALNNIAGALEDLGEKQGANDYYNRALQIWQELKAETEQARIWNNLGTLSYSLGNWQKALELYKRALALWPETGNRADKGYTLNNIAEVYNSKGEFRQALPYYLQALELHRKVGNRIGEFQTLNNIGGLYYRLRDLTKALGYLQQVLSIKRELKLRAQESVTLSNLGKVHADMGERQKALEFYNQALQIAKEFNNQSSEADVLNSLGTWHVQAGKVQPALGYFDGALEIKRKFGDQDGEAEVLNNLGKAYVATGQTLKALEFYDEARKLWRKLDNRIAEATALRNIGSVYEQRHNNKLAITFYEQSIARYEQVRFTAGLEEFKLTFATQISDVYRDALLLLLRSKQPIRAFALTEQSRARVFLDQLGNARLDIRRGIDQRILEQEQSLLLELKRLDKQLNEMYGKSDTAQRYTRVQELQASIVAKQGEYDQLLISIKALSPEYASLRVVTPLSLLQIQRRLGKDVTLLSYFVTAEKTLAFVITRNSFQIVEIQLRETELRGAITWFRAFARLGNPQPPINRRMHDWLIRPVKPHLKTSVIGIIPHGILHYLPFQALMDGQNYFGEDYTLFYLPSASVLPFIQSKRRPVGDSLFAVAHSQAEGLPLLQHASEEVATIAQFYNTQPIIDSRASKEAVLSRGGDYSIIHIAAHAQLNPLSPLFSRIMLASNEEGNEGLEVREVYSLNLDKTSLVILSACETELGAQSKGDDVIGLNRAFIYAGSPTVIASLWTVDDEATSILMKSFYTHLKQGLSKAESLQAAQRDTRKAYPHPYYWAAFVLTGDPGKGALQMRRD